MDDADVEVARLNVLKDGLVADHQAGQTWWQVVLGAGLALVAYGTYAGPFSLSAAVDVVAGSLLVLLAALLRKAYQRAFRQQLFVIARRIESLKDGGAR